MDSYQYDQICQNIKITHNLISKLNVLSSIDVLNIVKDQSIKDINFLIDEKNKLINSLIAENEYILNFLKDKSYKNIKIYHFILQFIKTIKLQKKYINTLSSADLFNHIDDKTVNHVKSMITIFNEIIMSYKYNAFHNTIKMKLNDIYYIYNIIHKIVIICNNSFLFKIFSETDDMFDEAVKMEPSSKNVYGRLSELEYIIELTKPIIPFSIMIEYNELRQFIKVNNLSW